MSEIQFIETDTDTMIAESKAIIEKLLNRTIQRADPVMLFLKALISVIAQQRELINDLAKMNLLAYARDEYLEKIGELVGVTRLPATAATCHVQITLTAPRNQTTIIKAGTRFNADNKINFALDEAVIFGAGETSKTATATCLEIGDIGNGYNAGEINKIVDPQPFLKSIVNTTMSEGGADIESDDSLRERIRIKPESFSVAGPAGAYIFFAKQVSSTIIDVYVDSPSAGCVDVYILEEGGTIPGEEMLQKVYDALSAEDKRPLTDSVTVKATVAISYDINLEYYISRDDKTKANSIVEKAENAVQDFILWQKSKLGRDIQPSELIYRMKSAGVDRIAIISPQFQEVPPHCVAIAQNISVIYKGLKNP